MVIIKWATKVAMAMRGSERRSKNKDVNNTAAVFYSVNKNNY